MKNILTFLVVIAVMAVAGYVIKGRTATAEMLGAPLSEGTRTITVAEALNHSGGDHAHIVLKGSLDRKCPTSGCWFYLKDSTGTIRVDTQFSGFNVVKVRVGSRVTVQGTIMQPNNGEPQLSAAGMIVER
jgi:uncharacterized protein YdeI (BOF family)